MKKLLLCLLLAGCATAEPPQVPECAHLDEDGIVLFADTCTVEEIEKYLLSFESDAPTP